ncbi:MAG: metal ABC transporter ATP-binding protein [Gammaproteobacteria bacterium]|nr:metal ABC transporter ATP-binding protein [Gammaproteobacteria bacterium]
MPARTLLEARELCLGYGSGLILEAVSLTVKEGEFWFLLGQNGTGKSTLVKAILGLLQPQSGVIRLHADLKDRRQVGFVPQQPEINPTLPTTVREFVTLGLVGIHSRPRDTAQRLSGALERVGLLGMERQDYWSLSAGQRQRVLVARALARHPRLLVMDEPTAGLDPTAESTLMGYLDTLNRVEGLTIFCVSHDLATAARRASHIALFDAGRILAGSTKDVLTQDNLQRIYGVVVGPVSQEMDLQHAPTRGHY